METINELQISYPDFQLNTVIEPEQFDTNNLEILTKINEIVAKHNALDSSKIPIVTIPDLSGTSIQALLVSLKAFVDAHKADTVNPHNVTAHQAGTYTSLEIDNLYNILNTRQSYVEGEYGDFLYLINNSTHINRIPYMFDGGDFGDSTSVNLILDGGDI